MSGPGVQRFDPLRPVEVELDGAWWPGSQDAWVRWPDGSWRASVEFVAEKEWGAGKHVMSVPEDRVRLRHA
ncbi:hypothetical protein [Blastococcus sp. CT_GayMR16]|uniref:hypothetical protein n=1 Tax=Blastococcus sp. CT_GayMR16 TaxID=2559607 RepID=UPI001073E5C9|nr:hypothetical protein [Blastococcus sp. CT_GayMR16]TFV90421.1 hypothetical protein E4P38_02990 [Blastococcus sp. CT_GayMR16]